MRPHSPIDEQTRPISSVELVNALEQEKLQGKPGQIAGRLTRNRSYSDNAAPDTSPEWERRTFTIMRL
jgi:hypothetical protein